MLRLPIYQVDAFADRPFEGNPAAVCPLEKWLDDDVMQSIAAENNLSETAFFISEGDGFGLRWFTPELEIDLCGHATLASAWVLFEELNYDGDQIAFETRSGQLVVTRDGKNLIMALPEIVAEPAVAPPAVRDGLHGPGPVETLLAPNGNYLVVYECENDVASMSPDLSKLATLERLGVIITAPGDERDFVSRYFAPAVGVNEDPVTGSAHSTLVPYWSKRLGKSRLSARQISARGGNLDCESVNGTVVLRGGAVTVLRGEFIC